MSEWPQGRGEMTARIRRFDWAGTALGPIAIWSDRLRLAVEQVLAKSNPACLIVGDDNTLIYNDGYAAMVGARHPALLGRNAREAFSEIRFSDYVGRAFGGETVDLADAFMPSMRDGAAEQAWFDISYIPVRNAAGAVIAVMADIRETTGWVQAAAERDEQARRQAFLLRLSDALRALKDPADIEGEAARILGESLDAAWVYYAEYDMGASTLTIRSDYRREDSPSLAGTYPIASFDMLGELTAGRQATAEDIMTSPLMSGDSRARWSPLGVRSVAAVPIVKDGTLLAAVIVADTKPRDWSSAIALVEATAERTWGAVERGRAEAALRESEERFRQFAEASSGALWIRDATTLALEYASPAIAKIYGVEPDALLGELKRWAALIVPEDRGPALDNTERARRGESVIHEFRIQRADDQAFRWIRDTNFPLLDEQGAVQRIGGIAEDITEAKLAIEHQAVLLSELQHRVRNIMAIIRSITARTGERAESVAEYAELMAGRLLALARVQALLTRAANVSVGIGTIVKDEVSVQAQHDSQYDIEGPDISLSPKVAEVLTLAIHELTTNALKYGALSVPAGKVSVRWSTFERAGVTWLAFKWVETGCPDRPWPAGKPRRRGFGSELIEGRIPYELGGRGRLVLEPGGAQCHLEFPLKEGPSILETGAPQRGSVFGGALDMTGEPDLSGHRILVVEDDYYLATDTARALQGAGAEVTGVCATEEAAGAELAGQRPDAVVVDINLGSGPSFKIAETLKDRSIPFVFVTGYDQGVIPEEFSDVERLEKPVQLSQIVGAVSKLLRSAA